MLACAGLPAHAAPFKPSQVSDKANWFAHADLDALRDTKVGQTVMKAVEDKHGARLRAIKRMFSVNPFEDLSSVTLYGSGKHDEGVVLIHGDYDRAHLEDLIAAAKDHETSQHGASTIHSWTDEKKNKPQHGAFYGEDLVVISDHKHLVRHALDVLSGDEPAMTGNAPFPAAPAPVMLGLVNLEGIDVRGKDATLVEKARSARGRIMEKGDHVVMELVIEATNEHDAEHFRKVLDGMLALGLLAHEELAAMEIDSSVAVDRDTFVTARVSVPSERILEFMEHAGHFRKLMN